MKSCHIDYCHAGMKSSRLVLRSERVEDLGQLPSIEFQKIAEYRVFGFSASLFKR